MSEGFFDSAPDRPEVQPEHQPKPRSRRKQKQDIWTGFKVFEDVVQQMQMKPDTLHLNHPKSCECSGCVAERLLHGE
jgi:hypothetical protein